MTIKRMLKFALPATLLAVSAQLYAAGEDATDPAVVKLAGDRGNVTWSAFTDAIKDHSTIKSDPTKELNATSDYIRNLNTANTALASANTALEDAQAKQKAAQEKADATKAPTEDEITKADSDLDDAKDAQTEKSQDLDAANAELTKAQDAYIKGFQDQLDNANDTLTKKNSDLQDLKEEKSRLEGQIADQEGYMKQAQATLKSLQNSTTLAKADSTVTKTMPWLSDIIKANNAFYDAYWSQEQTPEIWYLTVPQMKNIALYICFDKTAPSYVPSKNQEPWTKITPEMFYYTFIDSSDYDGTLSKDYSSTKIQSVYVYMGSDFAALNSDSPVYKIPTINSQTSKDDIVDYLDTAIKGLQDNAKYTETTTIASNRYKDPSAAQQTLKDIEDTEKEIRGYQETITNLTHQLKGYHPTSSDWVEGSTEITGVEEKIATVNAAIAVLNGSVTTEGSIKYLQAAVETAKTAVANDTATSDAITAAKNLVSNAKKAYDDAVEAVAAAQQVVDDLAKQQEAYETAQSDLTAANEAVTAAEKSAATAQENYDHYAAVAQEASDEAAYSKYYKDVTLNGDLTAAATGVNYDGTIIGDGNIITVTSGNLFNTFSGTLTNAAINGNFASNVLSAKFADVVRWNGTSGKYYTAEGVGTDYTGSNAFGKLGYALRDDRYFGVNFKTGALVATNDAPSLVYNITVNDFNGDAVNTQYYVQNINDNLISYNKQTVTIPVNRFAKSEDEFDYPNVYYGVNNTCSEVVIDDATKGSFYCPVDIQTKNVNLNRTFSKGYNTVCLPFALSYDYANSDDILSLCTFEKEDPERFWFTKVATTIPANTPVLMVAAKQTTLNLTDLANPITIKKTDAKQIVKGDVVEGCTSFGTFKYASSGEFLGESNAQYIFGLNKNGDFQRAGTGANFPAFRMVIATNQSHAANSQMRASGDAGSDIRTIGILDEDGNDITDKINTGVNNVTADNNAASGLSVAAGQGQLTITSDANYGDVAIYSIDGKVAAVANVTVGTTTVSLQHGVYIVLGKKVLVK